MKVPFPVFIFSYILFPVFTLVPVFGKYPTSASTSFSPLATADLRFYQAKLGFHYFQPHIIKVRWIQSPSLILPGSKETPLTFHCYYYIILITVTIINLDPPCIPPPHFPVPHCSWFPQSLLCSSHYKAHNVTHSPQPSSPEPGPSSAFANIQLPVHTQNLHL